MTYAFAEYIPLLLALHRLIREGTDEAPEGDHLRDAMDERWYRMADEERYLVDKLSAHLYAIGDRSTGAPPPFDVRASFQQAWGAKNWEAVLDLLEDHPGLAAPGQRSFLRSMAWGALGVPEAADEFFEDAWRTGKGGQLELNEVSGPLSPNTPAAGGARFPSFRNSPELMMV